jgi:uncharacterized protein YprB with RNaseH-like and TPR domain
VNLKQKLAQLAEATPLGSAQLVQPWRIPQQSAGESPSERDLVLSKLREQMATLMTRQQVPTRVMAPCAAPLDFTPFETSTGWVHRRIRRWSTEHWIGCMPVKAALDARAEFWAMLSLDPRLASSQPRRALFLDTETTGLGGGAGILAFLIGLAWFDADGLVLEQLLLRSPADEVAQLEILTDRIASSSLLVTFNGKSFDWPLLANRYVMNRLELPLLAHHFDLLHVARRLHKPRMSRVNLKALEVETLSLDRGPDIDGAEMGPRYSHFLRTGDEEALRPVIEHNAIDVLSMVALAGLYGEPMARIDTADLVPLGRVLRRARDLDRAEQVAERALQLGGGAEAQRLRAELARARGDRDRAIADFEAICDCVDDPKLRLELAKLYEHHAKKPLQALALLERGTGESVTAAERRRARLQRKLQSSERN